MSNTRLDQKAIAVIKGLILDGTRKANSGHPGGAMSSTDFAYILFKEFLQFSPDNPDWFNRDRFILSAGHESMLLYSLLALQGFLSVKELEKFRQFGSLTPGHPETDITPGVEATTGPLGQGVGMGVGIAIANEMLKDQLGKEIIDHFTYVLSGDGDLQAPVALGAASIAGHLGLGKLIMYYDRNARQISGSIDRADSTDVAGVFRNFGWQVIEIDGHDYDAIRTAIETAQRKTLQPTLIIGETIMAYGSATREGDHETHGAPLSQEEIAATKEKLGLPKEKFFFIPDDVLVHFRKRFKELKDLENTWTKNLNIKTNSNQNFAGLWDQIINDKLSGIKMPDFPVDQQIATRAAFGKILETLVTQIPNLAGGSADLEPSNATAAFAKKVNDFTCSDRSGRNLAFGVREFPMGAILNGMALHGGLIPFGATFLVFADYERPALRLSALQKLRVLHIYSHDSFYVGEDGPTHQPIEHISTLRIIPGLTLFRPADATETIEAIKLALNQKTTPYALTFPRRKLPVLDRKKYPSATMVKKGAYIISGDKNEVPDIIFIATGSEVHLALETAKKFTATKVRVVSMPSMELFEEEDISYQNNVIPPEVDKRVTIEAASTFGWNKYAGTNGITYGIDHYGNSAPADVLEEIYGFTPEKLFKKIKSVYGNS
ncbi:MAG: transketolase [Bacteroidales bacterium]|nr:transketolase [Bacteroidales bacterium]